MSYNWGYKNAAGHSKDMGLSTKAPRVEVKTHTRAPRMAKAPAAPVSPAKDMPHQPGMAKGNTKPAMQAFAKGGKVKLKKKGC